MTNATSSQRPGTWLWTGYPMLMLPDGEWWYRHWCRGCNRLRHQLSPFSRKCWECLGNPSWLDDLAGIPR